MIDDLLAWPLLVDLTAEMTAEIESAELPPFCFVGLLPGGSVALDYCQECGNSCGMAWVRLASIREEPSDTNPGGFSDCASLFVVNVEMGMVRCHQTFDDDNNPMPAEYQHDKVQAQMAEQAAMRRVLLCSDTALPFNKLLGNYLPIGPEGGCVGGAWTAQFEIS